MGRDEQFIERLRAHRLYRGPIAGAAGEGEGEGGAEGAGDEGASGDAGKDGSKDEGEHIVDVTGMESEEIGRRLGKAETELQRLRREKAEREKEMRKQSAAAKAQDEQRKAEQGEWKKLAEERADALMQATNELNDLRRRIEDDRRRGEVTKVADRLGFHNPDRAYALMREDFQDEEKLAETLESEQLIDAALKRMIKSEPYLVDRNRRTGAGMPGGNGRQPADPNKAHNELIVGLLGGVGPANME